MTETSVEEPQDQSITEPAPAKSERPPLEPFWDFKASHWTTAILTGGLVIVGFFQLCIYSRQTRIMASQAEIASNQTKIMQAEHRPWVSANPIVVVGKLEHTINGLQFDVGFKLKNTGHSPAKRAFPFIKASLKSIGESDQKKICEEADTSLQAVALSIFPGDDIPQQIGATVPEAEFVGEAERLAKIGINEIEAHPVYVGACIAYQDMETDQTHHTPYSFILAAMSEKPGLIALSGPILKQGGILDTARLFELPFSLPPD